MSHSVTVEDVRKQNFYRERSSSIAMASAPAQGGREKAGGRRRSSMSGFGAFLQAEELDSIYKAIKK